MSASVIGDATSKHHQSDSDAQPVASSSSSHHISTSFSTSPAFFSNPRVHIHPHGAHFEDPPTPFTGSGASSGAGAGNGDDHVGHEYEALPVGAGTWVNMMAGAMVRLQSLGIR
jgi:hypothetical protein